MTNLRANLDCRHLDARPLTDQGTRWRIRIDYPNGKPRGGRMCTTGSLVIRYAEGKTSRARYTFSATEDPRARRCRPDNWESIVENDFARVYSVRDRRYYVCRFDTGRARWFGHNYQGPELDAPDESVDEDVTRLTEGKVAYVLLETYGRYVTAQRQWLVVRDVASWLVEHELRGGYDPVYGSPDYGAPGEEYGFTDVALKENGAVAWIVDKGPSEGQFEVRKADATGEYVLLDSGSGIDRGSLTLDGSTLYWMKDSQPQTAPLY